MKKPFLNTFRDMYMTQDANLHPGIYMDHGLKPAEAFFSDISNNLVSWATEPSPDEEHVIYYETYKYWYRFAFENTNVGRMSGIVWLRRFELDAPTEITVFANKRDMSTWADKWKFDTDGKKIPLR